MFLDQFTSRDKRQLREAHPESGWATRMRRALSPELLSVLALQCLLIVPLQVASPWWSDDIFNSDLRGDLVVSHTSLLEHTYQVTKYWILHEGRLYPLVYLTIFPQFDLLTDRVVYKLVLAFWCLLATLACWWMLREFGLSRAAAALVSLLAVASMELRFFHDSLADHAGVVPLTFAELCVSLAFFDRWLREGRPRQMVASSLFLVWSLLTYETGYLFFIVFALVALRRRRDWRAALRASVVPIVICLAANVIEAILRTGVAPGDPYAPNYAPLPLARAFAEQFTGALPFVYAFAFKFPLSAPYDLFGHYGGRVFTSLHPIDLLGGALVAVVAYWLTERIRRGSGRGSMVLIGLIGLAIWVLVGAPVAVATRYQQILTPGVAFLPVFAESFGLGIVAVSAIVGLQRRFPRAAVPLSVTVALGAGVFAMLDHRVGVITEHAMNADQTPARVMEQRGRELLAAVPQHARLIVDPLYERLEEPGFFWQHAGKSLTRVPATRRSLLPAGGPASGCGPTSRTWELRHIGLAPNTPGLFLIGCVRRVGGLEATRATMTVGAPDAVDISGHVFDDPTAGRTGYSFIGPVSRVFRKVSKDDWLPPAGTDMTSLTVIPAPPSSLVVPGRGCYAPNPDGSFSCQRRADFEAENLGNHPQAIRAVLDVSDFAPGTRSATLTVNGQRPSVIAINNHYGSLITPPLVLGPGQWVRVTASVDAPTLLNPTTGTVMVIHDARTFPG